jgi:ATP-dependent Clp endopeptidase proteolytic subunit ClpP
MKVINRRWFSMKADGDEAEISIFDEIGAWGVTVGDFKRELDAVKDAAAITLYINSPGGDVFAAMAIYNLLAPLKEKITAHVLGWAASAASILALAGKTLRMGEGTYLMIHNPWAFSMGTAKDFRKMAELLDQIGGSMADIYTARSAHTREEILALMDEETWMTAQEAVDAGFADKIVENASAVAALAGDISKLPFHKMPEALLEKVVAKGNPPATPRDLEKVLRDAGYSRTVAAGIVSKGFSAVPAGGRDEQGSGSEPVTMEAARVDIEAIIEPVAPAAQGKKGNTVAAQMLRDSISEITKGRV